METQQKKIPFMRSLEGTNEQIKANMLIAIHKKTGVSVNDIALIKTGMNAHDYINRQFNRLMYYEWKRQRMKFKYVKINFWDL